MLCGSVQLSGTVKPSFITMWPRAVSAPGHGLACTSREPGAVPGATERLVGWLEDLHMQFKLM